MRCIIFSSIVALALFVGVANAEELYDNGSSAQENVQQRVGSENIADRVDYPESDSVDKTQIDDATILPDSNWDGYTEGGLPGIQPSTKVQQEFFSRNVMFLLTPLYYLDVAVEKKRDLQTIPIPKNYNVIRWIGRNGHPINGMVLESEKDMIIVLRGTKTSNEWIHNIRFNQLKPVFGEPDWRVHSGFWHLYDSSVRECFNEIVASARSKDNVYISAVSMGAAVGGLLAMEMAYDDPSLSSKLTVYTFGSPRVMNPAMARQYDVLVPQTYRVLNHHDPVTRLPLGNGIGKQGRYLMYKHVGNNFQVVIEPASWMPSRTVGYPNPLSHNILSAYYHPLADFFDKYEQDFKQDHWRDQWQDLREYSQGIFSQKRTSKKVTMRICASEDL